MMERTYHAPPRQLSPALSPLERFAKWLRLKKYQFEVTYSIYMHTSVEKFIDCSSAPSPKLACPPNFRHCADSFALWLFTDSVIFLLLSMIVIATTLYLPRHVAFLINRAYFYVHGEAIEGDVLEVAKEAVAQVIATGSESLKRDL
jgi:hypothetical protein